MEDDYELLLKNFRPECGHNFFQEIFISLFKAALGLRLLHLVRLMPSRGYSLVAVQGFLIAVASLAIEHMGSGCTGFSSCGSRALKCGVSSRGTQTLLLQGMWDLSRPGVEPASLAWQGRFVTTGSPGKPQELRIHPPLW